jgi:hypothetical protein
MKYKIDEEVVFHRVGHRYDGCVCTIDSIDENANLYILNVDDVKIVAEEYNLSEVPIPFEIGDIVSTANGTVLLYCRVIRDNKVVGNVVDVRGIAHNIKLYHITKADKDNTKKFFEQLKNNNPVSFKHLTDKVLREYNHHIKKILQILDYEID